METRLGGDSHAIAEIIVAIQAIEKQGEALDDEVPVVGDACAYIPWMALVEQVAFYAEGDIHRFEDSFHAAVLAQRDGSSKTVGQTQLEVEMPIAPSKVKQGVEFLKVIAR